MKEKWLVIRKGADYKSLSNALSVSPVVVRIMRNRGLETEEEMREFLYGDRGSLHDPHLLKDVDRAAEIILEKIREEKPIRIIGDYDIDGIMSTYILYKALLQCGARADTVIPNRIRDGYGLNIHLVSQAKDDGIDTILTCDNGIAAAQQIAFAKENGMTVVVTDHHEVPFQEKNGKRTEILPPADAVVNPKQKDDHYPFPGLCGAAVAWKFVQVLYERAGMDPKAADVFIENVGFATIGDVMDLQGENRILTRLGLQALNRTQNLGMRALIAQNKLNPGHIKAYHVGFRIGPCMNASGRLETADLSLQLLETRDIMKAVPLAQEITQLNEQRKEMTAQAVRKAEKEIEEKHYEEDTVFVIFLPDCHESLAGIVAGRIREKWNRPVLVVTRGAECAKGSGRSTESYSMFQELSRCRELFLKFGGHPMAAGFSLEERNIDTLRERLNALSPLKAEDLVPKIHIDVDMPIDYIDENLIAQLDQLEPFGKANEKPLFAQRNLQVRRLQVYGRENKVTKMLVHSDGGRTMEAVYFGDPGEIQNCIAEKYGTLSLKHLSVPDPSSPVRMHFCYYPTVNEYQGKRTLQIVVSHFC